ncbi:MAG: hypothetical protein EB127_08305 [Alphaproteobacteria bacterium]|nr:hypothetical protein [Alphaproteobacteria bacterium]
MAFQLSPGVLVTEKDLTAIVPAVATTAGGFAGNFAWGPSNVAVLVTNEQELVTEFGKPDANTYESFFTAANFLSYGNNLRLVRAATASTNASANSRATLRIGNDDDYDNSTTVSTGDIFLARYPGALGNSLKVAMADVATWSAWYDAYKSAFTSSPVTSAYAADRGGRHDELHVLVIDEDGLISGTAGTILEKYQFLSKASDAKATDGSVIYYKEAINQQSRYIRFASHPSYGQANANAYGSWGSIASSYTGGSANTNLLSNVSISMTGGTDVAVTQGNILGAYTQFVNEDIVDVSLVPTGNVAASTAQSIVGLLTGDFETKRNDVVVFVSPELDDVYNVSESTALSSVQSYRNTIGSSSYAVMDSGWKYQYDRYNDVYRWVPLNGDIAGLCVRTDFVADPWFSPAGYNRGGLKNVVKLAWNPGKAARDTLYKNNINPVVSQPGQGVVLFGDKTMQSKPSAFDRINVRRLFIVLEKAISTAAKFQLFELNDAFTRSQFINIVEPFLRDVQGRRGIIDYKIVCDETNNTSAVIDRNEFVADIFIKPARSINFITLNFIATRTGISFEEAGA